MSLRAYTQVGGVWTLAAGYPIANFTAEYSGASLTLRSGDNMAFASAVDVSLGATVNALVYGAGTTSIHTGSSGSLFVGPSGTITTLTSPAAGVAGLVQPAKVYWLSLTMALVSTVLPIWLMAEGVKRIGASQVSMISAVGPIITIYFGWLILNEPVTTIQIAGAVLVLAGVLLVGLKAEAIPAKS